MTVQELWKSSLKKKKAVHFGMPQAPSTWLCYLHVTSLDFVAGKNNGVILFLLVSTLISGCPSYTVRHTGIYIDMSFNILHGWDDLVMHERGRDCFLYICRIGSDFPSQV